MQVEIMESIWAETQIRMRAEEGPKPTAAGTLFRSSDAMQCLRQRALTALGVPETEEIDAKTLLAFEVGNALHETLQRTLVAHDPDVQIEVPIDLTEHLGVSLSGHTDGIVPQPVDGGDWILEIKTVAPYGFNLAVDEGPKLEHLAQAGGYGIGVGATHVWIVYVCKSDDFTKKLKQGDMLEWVVGMDEDTYGGYSPRELAETDAALLRETQQYVDWGMVPQRYIPMVGEVTEVPGYGARKGQWQCRYCRHNTTCRDLGPGVVEVNL